MTLTYMGNGPYCAANSLSMIFGDAGPGAAVVEVLSGTPFGIAIHGADLIYFTPPAWTPEFGINRAMEMLGWECERGHGDQEVAVAALRQATPEKPVLVGQIEMGLLPYIPGLGQAIGADHNIVVIGMEGDMVRAHDAQGWPFVTVPLDVLITTWRGDTFAYPADAFPFRRNFRRTKQVDAHTALRNSIPTAISLLDAQVIENTTERAAKIIEGGLTNMQWKYLVEFTIQGGARRLADAAVLYRKIGCGGAADILDRQARLVGSLQLSLTTRDDVASAATLRELGPTYGDLRAALERVDVG